MVESQNSSDNKDKGKTETESKQKVSKEVRFDLKGGNIEEKENEEDEAEKEKEVVIEFNINHPGQDNIFALSHSISKKWDEDDSIEVWETNEQSRGKEEPDKKNDKKPNASMCFNIDQETID